MKNEIKVSINELMESHRWIYWLDEMQTTKGADGELLNRVCIVFEGISGYYPTGGFDGKEPWWWNQETCVHANAEMGIDVMEAFEILDSSMRTTVDTLLKY